MEKEGMFNSEDIFRRMMGIDDSFNVEEVLTNFKKQQDEYQALANEDDANIDQFCSEDYPGRQELLERMSKVFSELQVSKTLLDTFNELGGSLGEAKASSAKYSSTKVLLESKTSSGTIFGK